MGKVVCISFSASSFSLAVYHSSGTVRTRTNQCSSFKEKREGCRRQENTSCPKNRFRLYCSGKQFNNYSINTLGEAKATTAGGPPLNSHTHTHTPGPRLLVFCTVSYCKKGSLPPHRFHCWQFAPGRLISIIYARCRVRKGGAVVGDVNLLFTVFF